MSTDMTRERLYKVVLNHEEQYSIWSADQETPAGWRDEGFVGPRETCLAHIDSVWVDMRPLSLRRQMASDDAAAIQNVAAGSSDRAAS